jgi:4-amino-4-deoxy-L-arabinose transferase-like glycosyltransferase
LNVWFLKREVGFQYNPLLFFGLFLCVNIVLTYLTLPILTWFNVLIWCFLLPFILGMTFKQKPHLSSNIPFFQTESKWNPSSYVVFLIISLGIFARVYLKDLCGYWPIPDEAKTACLSLEMAENGMHHFFYTDSQIPPFFFAALAFFFRIMTPSLFAIWLLPSLFSIAGFLLLYFAARQLFSNFFSFLFLTLISLSFLPIYLGRFCTYDAGHFFWESLCIAVLAWLAGSQNGILFWMKAFLLGFCVGFGFWVAIAWPVEAVIFGVFFYILSKGNQEKNRMTISFLIGFVVVLAPFIFTAANENYGFHIKNDFYVSPYSPGERIIRSIISHLMYLFWYGNDKKFLPQGDFVPSASGLLNPITSAFFFIGVIELFRLKKSIVVGLLFLSLIVCLLPGLLSMDFDIHRIDQIAPLLLLVATVGFQSTAQSFGTTKLKCILFILLTLSVSFLMDAFNLEKFNNINFFNPASSETSSNEPEIQKAYEIVKNEYTLSGPGFIFTEFSSAVLDQSFLISTFPFNANHNSKLPSPFSKWAAVILNIHYLPFLSNRFPLGHWYHLGPDPAWMYGDLCLFIIPLDAKTWPQIQRWIQAEQLLSQITNSIFNSPIDVPQQPVLNQFLAIRDFMRTDPFLESCFIDRVLFYRKIDGFSPTHLDLLQEGLKYGYPLPPFLLSEGVFLRNLGKFSEARRAFEKAVDSTLNFTPAESRLKELNAQSEEKPNGHVGSSSTSSTNQINK